MQCGTSLRKQYSSLDMDRLFQCGLIFSFIDKSVFLSSLFLAPLLQEAKIFGKIQLALDSIHQLYQYPLRHIFDVPYTFS